MSYFKCVRALLLVTQMLVAWVTVRAEIPVIDARTGLITRSSVRSAPATERRSPITDPRIRAATVRIEVDRGDGTSVGSGTIVAKDRGTALIISCGHLFEGTNGDAPIRVTFFTRDRQVRHVGQVHSFDAEADVAIVTAPAIPELTLIPLASADHRVSVGNRVIVAGCDDGGQPVSEFTTINELNRYIGHARLNVTTAPPHGRSGGGLITTDYVLIGVCRGIDQEAGDGVYAGLACIYQELAKSGNKLPAKFRFAASRAGRNHAMVTNAPLQDTPQPVLADSTPMVDVICIIKPTSKTDEPQVVHLRNVSASFLQALQHERASGP